MNRRTLLLPSVTLVLLTFSVGAQADAPCTPARIGAHVAAQPEAWRQAVEALVAASATPDQPWGCVGGEVDLVVEATSATLTVVDTHGHAITREIVSPDEVAPLGEALLAKPLEDPKPVEPPKPVTTAPPPKEKAQATIFGATHMLAAANVGIRYGGRSDVLWGTVQGFIGLQHRALGGGVWVRNDSFLPALNRTVPTVEELCGGASIFWAPTFGRLEFRAGGRASVAVITQRVLRENNFMQQPPPLPLPQPQPEPQPEQYSAHYEKTIDGRVGLEGQVAYGLTKWLRPVMGFDVEITPKRLGSSYEPRNQREMRTHLPSYTIGVSLGMEVAFP